MTDLFDPVTVALVLLLALTLGYLAHRVVDLLDNLLHEQHRTNDLLATLADRLTHERAVERALDRGHADAAAAADCLTYYIECSTNQPTNQPRRDGTGTR